ncbi:hypothetical protein ACU20_02800 [Actinobaculum suis]|nr:hypothetical protein ACU20_02800 [Actinobaculum suis]
MPQFVRPRQVASHLILPQVPLRGELPQKFRTASPPPRARHRRCKSGARADPFSSWLGQPAGQIWFLPGYFPPRGPGWAPRAANISQFSIAVFDRSFRFAVG